MADKFFCIHVSAVNEGEKKLVYKLDDCYFVPTKKIDEQTFCASSMAEAQEEADAFVEKERSENAYNITQDKYILSEGKRYPVIKLNLHAALCVKLNGFEACKTDPETKLAADRCVERIILGNLVRKCR